MTDDTLSEARVCLTLQPLEHGRVAVRLTVAPTSSSPRQPAVVASPEVRQLHSNANRIQFAVAQVALMALLANPYTGVIYQRGATTEDRINMLRDARQPRLPQQCFLAWTERSLPIYMLLMYRVSVVMGNSCLLPPMLCRPMAAAVAVALSDHRSCLSSTLVTTFLRHLPLQMMRCVPLPLHSSLSEDFRSYSSSRCSKRLLLSGVASYIVKLTAAPTVHTD